MKKAKGFGELKESSDKDEITVIYGELFPGGDDIRRVLKQHNKKWEYSIDLFALSYVNVGQHQIPVATLINNSKNKIINMLMLEESHKITSKQVKKCQTKLNKYYSSKLTS